MSGQILLLIQRSVVWIKTNMPFIGNTQWYMKATNKRIEKHQVTEQKVWVVISDKLISDKLEFQTKIQR